MTVTIKVQVLQEKELLIPQIVRDLDSTVLCILDSHSFETACAGHRCNNCLANYYNWNQFRKAQKGLCSAQSALM